MNSQEKQYAINRERDALNDAVNRLIGTKIKAEAAEAEYLKVVEGLIKALKDEVENKNG